MIVRYLLVPGVMMSLFAGLALGGFTTLPQGSRGRRLWAAGAGVAVVLGLVWTAFHPPSFVRFNNELVFRGESGRSLYALLDKPAVRKGLRCGPLSLPTHRVMPDSRWILDLPQRRVLARSQKSAAARRRMSYGVAIVPTSRTNVVRNTYFNEGTNVDRRRAAAGFRAGRGRSLLHRLRALPGPRSLSRGPARAAMVRCLQRGGAPAFSRPIGRAPVESPCGWPFWTGQPLVAGRRAPSARPPEGHS